MAIDTVRPDADLMVITQGGYGKRTPLADYRVTNRGGKGIRTLRVTEKLGLIAGGRVVQDDEELMIISRSGVMIRLPVSGISRQGRNAQGVRLMRVDEGDAVRGCSRGGKGRRRIRRKSAYALEKRLVVGRHGLGAGLRRPSRTGSGEWLTNRRSSVRIRKCQLADSSKEAG